MMLENGILAACRLNFCLEMRLCEVFTAMWVGWWAGVLVYAA